MDSHTVPARYEEAQETLAEMKNPCSPLGTRLVIDEDIEGRPVGVIDIPQPKATPRDKPDSSLAVAEFPMQGEKISATVPDAVLTSKIPEDACKVTPPTELAPNMELLAYRLPDTAREGGILHVVTWWRVIGPVDRNVMLGLQLSVEGKTPRRGTPWYTRHDAGDWTVPLSRLKSGQIVEDRYPARLAGLPAGPCKVYAVVMDTSRPEETRILGPRHLLGEVNILPRTEK